MKKILCFVLSAVLMMSFMMVSVSAAGSAAVTGSTGTVTATAGDTVTIDFSISEATFAAYGMVIEYDSNAFTLKSVDQGPASEGMFVANVANGKVDCANATDSTVSGVLFTATFEVKDGVKCGTYDVNASIRSIVAADTSVLSVTTTNGSIVIDHSWGDWSQTQAPTCKEEGEETRVCSVCGEKETRPVAKSTNHSYDAGVETKPATCTEKGEKKFTCTVCGHFYTEEIDALGHKYDNGKVTKEATCTEDGVKTYTCARCGHTYTEAIKATGHKWDKGEVTKAATCEEDGVMTYTCTVCGHTSTEVIKATGHNWTDWEVVKKPTENEKGLEQRTCLNCGKVETREIEPGKDQVPETGVRSNNYGALAVVAVVAGAAVAYIWKRRTAN